jgi:hypothetical protein
MKCSNAQSAYAESTPISDAEMFAVLANSSWARMESEARNAAATFEGYEEDFDQDRCA